MILTEDQLKYITRGVVEKIKEEYYLVPKKPDYKSKDTQELILSVAQFVSEREDILLEDMRLKTRKWANMHARDMAIYLTRVIYEKHISFDKIAEFYNRDHATAMHSYRKINQMMKDKRSVKIKMEMCQEEYKIRYNGF